MSQRCKLKSLQFFVLVFGGEDIAMNLTPDLFFACSTNKPCD